MKLPTVVTQIDGRETMAEVITVLFRDGKVLLRYVDNDGETRLTLQPIKVFLEQYPIVTSYA